MALKKNEGPVDIRRVRFGLRLKFLLLLSVLIIAVISIITSVMFFNQKNLLIEGKKSKADVLTHILSEPAEFYLDVNDDNSLRAVKNNYEYISKEAAYFMHFNEDIEKIILFDSKGRIKFSTDNGDYKKNENFPFIGNAIKDQQNVPLLYDFKGVVNKKSKSSASVMSEYDNYFSRLYKLFKKDDVGEEMNISLTSITYNVFLNRDRIDDLLRDFDEFYKQYYDSITKNQNEIYGNLFSKYIRDLDKKSKIIQGSNKRSKYSMYADDIDFLFHELFSSIVNKRPGRIDKSDRWLFNDNWLLAEKARKEKAVKQNLPEKVKEINDLIFSRMQELAGKTGKIRYLGAAAVVFNNVKVEYELNRTINRSIIFSVIMIAATLLAFYFILTFMIRNLKKLEKWAGSVSEGNLDTKIVINSNDEIGRLSDIFNNMISQMAIKLQLEKYLSSSAISMIKKKSDSAAGLIGDIAEKNNFSGPTETEKRRPLVFLFSDVRGFTSFSEKNDSTIVRETLNFYLELQSDIIMANKGDIDNFIGDEIMAHFRDENRIEEAIDSAIQIMKKIEAENINRKKENYPTFEVGIGIHFGEVVVGNIGTKNRMHFTCIGDAVNLAARLCSNAEPNEILVSKETYTLSSKKYQAINVAPISVKNKEKPIPIVKIKV